LSHGKLTGLRARLIRKKLSEDTASFNSIKKKLSSPIDFTASAAICRSNFRHPRGRDE
jgi:hypothetical protein